MVEILHPGVFVSEVQGGGTPVEPAGTSTAGFVGYAKRGEVGKAVLVTSWTDFVNKFSYGLSSPFMANSNLAYAVYGFFQNGGSRAYVVRAASNSAAKAKHSLKDATAGDAFLVEAIDEGAFGDFISYKLTAVNGGEGYDLVINFDGDTVAEYRSVSLDPVSDNFVEHVVNGVDKFVKVVAIDTPDGAELGVENKLTGGRDGITDATESTLSDAFNKFDTVRVNLLVCPESQAMAVNQAGLVYAEKKQAFYVMDGLLDATVDTIQTERNAYNSEYGGLYFPWIKVADPIAKGSDRTRFVPVGGHIAGVIARTDGLRGVFKAPAGLEAGVRGALDVKVQVTDETQPLLNPKGINAVRALSGAGIVVWGARTVSSNPAVKYVNVRRSLLFLRQSLQDSTRWAVFEPNNEKLWARLKTAADGFLLGQYREGMFKGTPETAFFVKCDAELNPQEQIDLGFVNMEIGVSINKPGEFIVIKIGQMAGGNE